MCVCVCIPGWQEHREVVCFRSLQQTLETRFYIIVFTFNYYILVLSSTETFLCSNLYGAFHIYRLYLIPSLKVANNWYAFDPKLKQSNPTLGAASPPPIISFRSHLNISRSPSGRTVWTSLPTAVTSHASEKATPQSRSVTFCPLPTTQTDAFLCRDTSVSLKPFNFSFLLLFIKMTFICTWNSFGSDSS